LGPFAFVSQIAIDSAVFPEGTSGQQLDVLARRALWKDGLNYLVRFVLLNSYNGNTDCFLRRK
jgi:Xaa-Pro aminopeptidase